MLAQTKIKLIVSYRLNKFLLESNSRAGSARGIFYFTEIVNLIVIRTLLNLVQTHILNEINNTPPAILFC